MAEILFLEKSGCSGNRRQKALLEAAGHRVTAQDLRDVCWSRSRLLHFLGDLPVAQWFNRSAPALKRGEIVPESLSVSAALSLLQENPLLIRRPLMESDGLCQVGFDTAAVHAWIGLGDGPLPARNLDACAHGASADAARHCTDPRENLLPKHPRYHRHT
ncbi:MAG: hypothetical protein M0P39_00045 [Rhodocyclaceae bacterium]|nr:hypothetical protein [Rhodocyclaceae bacterium]